MSADLSEEFESLFGEKPRVYRAPGRVNLIGEHTDYNDGFVMPAAIGFSTFVRVAPREDRRIVIRSENFPDAVEFDLDDANPRAHGSWGDYCRGVALMLERAGYRLRGARMLIRGEVPVGSGLSSSAAIEVATGFALLENSGAGIDRLKLAKICQQAENEFVGIRSGLMDQFCSCFAVMGHVLLLDCRSLEYRPLPFPEQVKLVVCNTMVKHSLASSEYNARRAECEEGVRLLARELPHVRRLRDVTLSDLDRFKAKLPDLIYRRCRHVVSENDRTVEAAKALEHGDLVLFGRLMDESHRSLREDYEVSCAELDLMVDLSRELEGVYGARMTGGGFGGCTVNLVETTSVDSFKQVVASRYARATGLAPDIYVFSPAQGAERVGA